MAKPRRVSVAKRDLNSRPHILYRFWDAQDVLLYVGISVDSASRIANHMRDQPWWPDVETIKFTTFPNRKAALEAEAEMIRTLKPLYNVVHNEMVEEEDGPAITAEWLIENWAKLPATTRDVVEVPAWHLGRLELADSILDWTHEGDREVAEADAREYEGEDLDEDDLKVATAEAFVRSMWSERLNYRYAMRDLWSSLPQALADRCRARAEADFASMAGAASASDIETRALRHYADEMIVTSFALQAPQRRMVWLRIADALAPNSSEFQRAVLAARWALDYSEAEVKPDGLCVMTDNHDQICESLASYSATFADCGWCEGREQCRPHVIFCERHAATVEAAYFVTPLGKRWQRVSRCFEASATLTFTATQDPWVVADAA
jgi:predicted GIY-YIG superfamily endonuclease